MIEFTGASGEPITVNRATIQSFFSSTTEDGRVITAIVFGMGHVMAVLDSYEDVKARVSPN